uniref:TSA: Wollemia nobilis Ref_Wollemi_Transcript_6818_1082 transcribed RNA sequence n=1 Tax=Wollemia nobilis TaxID=56998 RepID=A0A0C9S816_9CONI
MRNFNLFSFISWRDWWLQKYFTYSGMTSQLIQLDRATQMHCWVPKTVCPKKQSLVLIHGFGANAMWQWHPQIKPLLHNFNLYIPDLVFFGKSFSTGSERSELFQAESVMMVLKHLGVSRFHLGGISYGGFVAYRLAHLYPETVDKVVIISSNVCMVPDDRNDLMRTDDSKTVPEILLPQTPDDFKTLMKFAIHRPPRMLPSFLLQDFINIMYTEQREQKVELLKQLVIGTQEAPPLPVLTQETLIIWGEHDHVFPLDLGKRLKRHLGDRAKLEVIEDVGHASQLEKPDEFNYLINTFLLDSSTFCGQQHFFTLGCCSSN